MLVRVAQLQQLLNAWGRNWRLLSLGSLRPTLGGQGSSLPLLPTRHYGSMRVAHPLNCFRCIADPASP
jgi:hypothetical protein